MTSASRPTFLRNFSRSPSSPPRRPPDFADLGTAFGLDEAIESGSIDSVVPGDPNPPPLRAAAPAAHWWLWLGRKLGA